MRLDASAYASYASTAAASASSSDAKIGSAAAAVVGPALGAAASGDEQAVAPRRTAHASAASAARGRGIRFGRLAGEASGMRTTVGDGAAARGRLSPSVRGSWHPLAA